MLRVYRMSEAEAAEDQERDLEMFRAGRMSEREFFKRSSTRSLARNIRRRDEGGSWPRDAREKPTSQLQKAKSSFH
jgi:hypothetical protein